MEKLSREQAAANLAAAEADAAEWKAKQAEIESNFSPEDKAQLAAWRAGEEEPGDRAGEGETQKRKVTCPYCTGKVLTKNAGRLFSTIPGLLQRSFPIRIPTGLLSFIQQKGPVNVSSIFKSECAVCGGKQQIEDPSDDSSKYKQVKQAAESKSKEITELEAKLAPPCGNRYTVIQGCDLLEVGLGMNDAPSYRVDKEKSIRSKGLIDPSKINTKKGGPQVPEGGKANHVQGLNPLASPGGHYMIKCANKFTLLVGAQGIDITTGGPIVIGGGITKITGPEISIGTQTGRLSLQGEVVDISGKSIEMCPTDGHVFVKGTISNTGNLMVGGHLHGESISFTKAECVGKNEHTKPAAASDLACGPAFWGGNGVEGLMLALKDMVGFIVSKVANPLEAQQMMTQRFVEGIRDKMLNVTYNSRPWELSPTGYILPGTSIMLQNATVPCNQGGTAIGNVIGTVRMPIPINNFPHCHALPDGEHTHEVRLPDLDFTADSAEDLRGKQTGVSNNAPLHKSSGSAAGGAVGLFSAISTVFVGGWKMIQGGSGPYQK
jgi:DNA-directed RNA polymerase subunit RPC12/RpoP